MAGPFSGFIKAARSGVGSMADAIGSAFSSGAEEASAASRWTASETMMHGEKVGRAFGTAAKETYQRPLVKAGPVTLLPSLESVGSSVGRAVKNPTPSNVGDAAMGVANMALLGKGEGGVGVFGAAARGLERAGGLASEAGAVKPGFLRSAGEVFAANRAATAAKMADVAGETTGAAQKAVKAAKMLVNPETKMVMTKAEQVGSGLVSDAQVVGHGAVAAEHATNAGARAAVDAAEAAKTAAKAAAEEVSTAPGRGGRFAAYVKGKAIGALKSPVTGPIETGKAFVSAGRDIVQAVTHPQLLSRPFSAPARAAGTAGKVAGKTVMGTMHSLPAAAVVAGADAVVQDARRPGMGDVADKEMAKNMGMSVDDFRGIRAVSQQKGEAGIAALVSGLKKAQAAGLPAAEAAATGGGLAGAGAKIAAKSILRKSVSKAYKMRG